MSRNVAFWMSDCIMSEDVINYIFRSQSRNKTLGARERGKDDIRRMLNLVDLFVLFVSENRKNPKITKI